ncbi:hypothetical protein D3C81_1301290 [compost metagenome]
MPLPMLPQRRIRFTATLARKNAQPSSMPLLMKSTGLAMSSSPPCAAKRRCQPGVFKVNGGVPAASCVCSPKYCVAATFTVRASTERCRTANRCRVRICASTASRSGRWRCSVPATFRWHSPPPVAIPLRHWLPVARWCSRLTAGTWRRPNGWQTPSFAPPSARKCQPACST